MNKHFCPYCMNPVSDSDSCPSCGLTAGTYTPNQNHLPPGTILNDRYLVGRVLGEGGFGITYIGCDLRLEMKVAIKEYFPVDKAQRISEVSLEISVPSTHAQQSFRSGKERFLEEARVMARMDKQPEIVGVRDFFECHNTAYIVMEYVEGTTFKQLVAQRGGGIPARELLPMVKPLFGALSNLHALGLIHRDISPDNLMLEQGRVRLIDFGCARQPEKGEATMTIVLKHGYAPIEQYTNRGQGPWTDVYALSATLYYCLVGQTPPQAMDRAVEDEIILPRKLGVDLTEEQETALLYGMGVKRRQRYGSMQELYAALYQSDPDPIQVTIPVLSSCRGAEDQTGFRFELVDADGNTVKTAVTDKNGRCGFRLTFDKQTIGAAYTYRVRAKDVPIPEATVSKQEYAISISIAKDGTQLTAALRKNGQPMEADEVLEFSGSCRSRKKPVKKTERTKDPKRKLPDWVPSAAVLVAIALLLLWLIPGLIQEHRANTPKEPEVLQDQPSDAPEAPEDVPEPVQPEAVFEQARVLHSGDQNLYSALFNAPVIVRNTGFGYSESNTLVNHLKIEAGACVSFDVPMTIPTGTVVLVEGELNVNESVYVERGAILAVTGDGLIRGHVVFEEEADSFQCSTEQRLRLQEEHGARFYDLQMNLVDSAGVSVNTPDQFYRAAEDPENNPVIVVNSDLTLNRQVHVQVPLIVNATLQIPYHGEDSEILFLTLAPGTPMIIHGRVEAPVNLEGEGWENALILNRGELHTRGYFHGAVFNYGWMASEHLIQLFGGGILFNQNSLELHQGSFWVLGGEFRNNGDVHASTELSVDSGGFLMNCGSISLQEQAILYNKCHMNNGGSLTVGAGCKLQNEGLLELSSGELIREDGCEITNDTVVYVHDPVYGLGLPGQVQFFQHGIHNAGKMTMIAVNEADFFAALQDPSVGLNETHEAIHLTESAVVDKNLIIHGELTMAEGTQLELRAEAHINGTLDAPSVLIRGADSNVIVHGRLATSRLQLGQDTEPGALLNYGWIDLRQGRLTLEGTSSLINLNNIEQVDTLTVAQRSYLVQRCWLQMEQTHVTADGCLLFASGQDLNGSTMEISSSGILRTYGGWFSLYGSTLILQEQAVQDSQNTGWHVDGSSALETAGGMHFFGISEFGITLDGRLDNTGVIQIGVPSNLNGDIHNHGEIQLSTGEGFAFGTNVSWEGNLPVSMHE